jgi:hypothetical protein
VGTVGIFGRICRCVSLLAAHAPSNNRDWQPDLAILDWTDITGDKVTIHNIRNCDYRTETDFTCHYYDKTFDLAKLKGVDFFLVYWGSPKIAHTMMSFDFEGQGNVCFSIETRKVFLSYLAEVNRLKEQPEWYNALTGNCTTSIRWHTMPYNQGQDCR